MPLPKACQHLWDLVLGTLPTLPIPPIPRIPRTLCSGSCPITVSPLHLPSRMAVSGVMACRRAPIMRNIATSAVASSTAIGVLDIEIPVACQHEADLQTPDSILTSLSTSIDVNIVISRPVMCYPFQGLWQQRDHFLVERPSNLHALASATQSLLLIKFKMYRG